MQVSCDCLACTSAKSLNRRHHLVLTPDMLPSRSASPGRPPPADLWSPWTGVTNPTPRLTLSGPPGIAATHSGRKRMTKTPRHMRQMAAAELLTRYIPGSCRPLFCRHAQGGVRDVIWCRWLPAALYDFHMGLYRLSPGTRRLSRLPGPPPGPPRPPPPAPPPGPAAL